MTSFRFARLIPEGIGVTVLASPDSSFWSVSGVSVPDSSFLSVSGSSVTAGSSSLAASVTSGVV